MKVRWFDIWGSARGPLCLLAPQTRILCGLAVFVLTMVAPAARWEGVVLGATAVLGWTLSVRPPGRVVRVTMLFGLALFLPYFLLVPLLHDPAAQVGWLDAVGVCWAVLFHGMTAMVVSVTAATSLSLSALRRGLRHLPVPRVVAAVLVQIIHQTGNLLDETRQIASAIAVRGGTAGTRTGIRVLASLPKVWLPRVIERAERVGAAMELRGYGVRDMVVLGADAVSWRDRLAVAIAVAAMSGAVALRLWGGA